MTDPTEQEQGWLETADEQMAKTLPEAPASANLRVYIDGFSAQITIRGINHKTLLVDIEELVKMAKLKNWSPSWNPTTNKELGYTTPVQHAAPPTPALNGSSITRMCETHNMVMEQKFSQPKQKFYFVHYDGKRPCFGKGYL